MKFLATTTRYRRAAQTGFTLLELLIVIAIIGVLMSIVTVNFIVVRQRARDAERKTDLVQLQSAFEFYRTDTGTYPTTAAFSAANCGQAFQNGAAVYLKKIPCDPLNDLPYQYLPDASGMSYTLYACLENASDKDKAAYPGSGTACDSDAYYVVTDP
jgi:general secretion pathway protein G